MGEPAGIGAEVTLKAWMRRHAETVPPFFVIDDRDRLAHLAADLRLTIPVKALTTTDEALSVFPEALPVLPHPIGPFVQPGHPDPAAGRVVMESIAKAVDLARSGAVAAIVTNPIHKATLYASGFAYPGHTEYLSDLCGPGYRPVMLLQVQDLRVVPLTVHLPLRNAIDALTQDLIETTARVVDTALRTDFGLSDPRMVIAGLNPHAGEGGTLGIEEITVIRPAVSRLQAVGLNITGPWPADTLFHAAARRQYDAALCLYHDQALIPLKTIDFDTGVNITLGLPIVRTSPDHGTALDIAGRGLANPSSMIAALGAAAALAAQRSRWAAIPAPS